jgi:hypothetical protein
VEGLSSLAALRAMSVSGCESLQELDLGGLTALQQLHIRGCARLHAVDGETELAALTRLAVAHCRHLPTLDKEGTTARPTEPWKLLLEVRQQRASAVQRSAIIRGSALNHGFGLQAVQYLTISMECMSFLLHIFRALTCCSAAAACRMGLMTPCQGWLPRTQQCLKVHHRKCLPPPCNNQAVQQ